MKRKGLLLLICLLLIPIVTKAVVTNAPDVNSLNVYLFCESDNKQCEEEYTFLKSKSDEIKELVVNYVSVKENSYLVNNVKEKLEMQLIVMFLLIIVI